MGVINTYFQLLFNYFSDELHLPKIIIDALNTDKDGIILGCCKYEKLNAI